MKIMITPREHIWPVITTEQLDRIRATGVEEIVVAGDRETQLREIRDCDALIGSIDPELFEHAGQLRWVQALTSGADAYLFPEFVESDVILTTEKGLVGPHLADHAMALLLALTRSIVTARDIRRWEERGPMRRANRELTGMTAGLIGLGGTGKATAERARAFGITCLAIDPDVTEAPEGVDLLGGPEKLIDMAARCDILFVCCPKAPGTLNMVNAEVLAALKPNGYVINVTRGGVIDEDALMAAIDSGHLFGAGLDVVAEEPLPADSPLWSYDRIIITPHIAGASQFRIGRIIERVFTNIQHFRNGEPLEGVIDKHKGY